jgi:3-oxoacyl-[acyl-carrier protein] reductase
MSDSSDAERAVAAIREGARLPRYPDLEGKIAFVTGSSRGIGFVAATALAANSAKVILNGRDREKLRQATETIRSAGGDVTLIPADMTDPQAVRTASDQIHSKYGTIDILVANVGGVGTPVPTAEETEDHWRIVVDANLTATFLTIRAFLPQMIARGSGSIITVSSTAGRQPSEASAAYAAAKAGVVMLTRHLAKEVGPKGVRVNCVAPGVVLTAEGALAKAPREVQDRVAAMHPIGRVGRPEDIADAILYLASESSSWITGVTLDISGGRVTA